MLREEGLIANQIVIRRFLQKHREMNSIERKPGSGQPTKMTAAVKALVERQMDGGMGGMTMKRPRFSCMLYFYAMAVP